jgi:hypothetical protein
MTQGESSIHLDYSAHLVNDAYRIANPLAAIPRDTLLRDVEQFAQENNLNDVLPLLRKGALIAQDAGVYEEVGLDNNERLAIRNEVLHKWNQPMALYMTIFICSIGAAVQ